MLNYLRFKLLPTHTNVAAHVAYCKVAGSFGRHVREEGLNSHCTRIILHCQFIDDQRLHWRHLQLSDTLGQIRSQVVEALLDALVYLWVGPPAW